MKEKGDVEFSSKLKMFLDIVLTQHFCGYFLNRISKNHAQINPVQSTAQGSYVTQLHGLRDLQNNSYLLADWNSQLFLTVKLKFYGVFIYTQPVGCVSETAKI